MDNLGFCVFGRPSGHEYVANGLADKLNVGQSTYIRFENHKFSTGDSFAEISREYVDDKEIIKVLVYQFAESYDKRAGGFVGSGIVFHGKPAKKLLFSALKANHRIAMELIDSATNRFKSQGFDKDKLNKNLIDPSTEGLLKSVNPKKSQSKSINGEYGLIIEGSLFNNILSAVQGFMMNPTFGAIKKLHVSSNSSLLADRVGQGKVLSFAHLLDFTKYFNSYNDHLKRIETKYRSIESQYKEKLEEQKIIENNIENRKNEKQQLNRKIDDYRKSLTDIENKLKQNDQKSEQLSKEINEKRNELNSIKGKINSLAGEGFKKAISKEPFKSEFGKVKARYEDKIKGLEEEVERLKEGSQSSKKDLLIISGIGIGLVLIGLFIGSFFLSNLFGDDSPETIAGNEEPPQTIVEQPVKKTLEQLKAPSIYSAKAFMLLDDDTVAVHKAQLDQFIQQVEAADTSKYDLSNFFNRKWNFAEVIDYNKESLDKGLSRLMRIKKIYNKHNRSVKLFEKDYLIPDFEQYSIQKIEFRTASRNDILEKYLEKQGNIYEGLNGAIENGVNYEEEMPLLYMHFRWVVFNLTGYVGSDGNTSKNGDILKTTKTKHNVPLK